MATQTLANLPTINLSEEILKPGTSSWLTTCNAVRHALEEFGFFVAFYDNQVSSEFEKQLFNALRELFDLPLETKRKNTSDLLLCSYVGQLPHAPLHESFGIPNATTVEGVESFTNLMWPSGNNKFSKIILPYARIAAELEKLANKMVFESYGVQRHYESLAESTTYVLRPFKYPTPRENQNNVAANIHTDKSFITILFQNQVNGLEVLLKNGQWFALDIPPSSFVVMAGDACEAWSNGRIVPVKHQVVMKGDKERYSVGLFSFKGTVNTPEELVDFDHPLQYKPFDHYGLVRYYFSGVEHMEDSTVKQYCGNTTA